jgi:ABC-type multidrug transport system permease subunit
VDYATIHLILRSPQTTTGYSLGDRVSDLFDGFGDFASVVLVVLLGIVIFGVPLIIIFFVAFWLLFGRIGLLKKAFRLAAGNSPDKAKTDGTNVELHKKE